MSSELTPVSVVIPCWHCVGTIERAVSSVAGQTLRPAELILVDDASEDDTLSVLYSLRKRYGDWVKVVESGANKGPGGARNLGWESAKYDYIAFLDSDDAFHPRKIEIQYGMMSMDPALALSGNLTIVLKEAEPFPAVPEKMDVTVQTKRRVLLANPFSNSSVMLRRDIQLRFLPDKRHSEDFLLWTSIVAMGHRAIRIEAPLSVMYKAKFGEAGLSADLWKMGLGELDTYARLKKEGAINGPTLQVLRSYSVLKLIRRYIIRAFRVRKLD